MAVEFVEKKLISNMIISYSGDIEGIGGHWGQTLWEMNKETKSALKVV